jgi:hypothetical protein
MTCEKTGGKTVDDARVSRENSKCARKRRLGVAGIPHAQEEKHSCKYGFGVVSAAFWLAPF